MLAMALDKDNLRICKNFMSLNSFSHRILLRWAGQLGRDIGFDCDDLYTNSKEPAQSQPRVPVHCLMHCHTLCGNAKSRIRLWQLDRYVQQDRDVGFHRLALLTNSEEPVQSQPRVPVHCPMLRHAQCGEALSRNRLWRVVTYVQKYRDVGFSPSRFIY